MLLAGPAANFVFAVCAYWVLFAVGVPALKPVIGEVAQDSIAARAGLAAGDEIVAVGGRETHTREATVLAILDRLMQQRPIEIELKREDGSGRATTLRVLGSSRGLTEPGALLPGLGFDFWYPTVPAIVGVVVPDSPAARAGLEPGDRIVAIEGRPVADFPALVQRVQPNPGRTLQFTIERPDGAVTLPIEVQSQREGDRMVGRIVDLLAIELTLAPRPSDGVGGLAVGGVDARQSCRDPRLRRWVVPRSGQVHGAGIEQLTGAAS